MAIPKSKKLCEEIASEPTHGTPACITAQKPTTQQETIQIKIVPCLNDFVAVLRLKNSSSIVITDTTYKNEGIIVGIGPDARSAAKDPDETAYNPAYDHILANYADIKIGDVVLFLERNIVVKIESETPPYVGEQICIISKKNLLCKLPNDFKLEFLDLQE